MGECAYCAEEKKLTREHIIPNWYGVALGVGGSTFVEKAPDKLVSADPKIKDVCAQCNNVVLGALDDYGKSLYIQYFSKPVFLRQKKRFRVDQNILVRWLMKVAYNSARANSADLHVLSNYAKDILNGEGLENILVFCMSIAPSAITSYGCQMARGDGSEELVMPQAFRVGVYRIAESDWYKWSFRYVFIDSYVFYLAIPMKDEGVIAERKSVLAAMLKSGNYGSRVVDGVISLRAPKHHAVEIQAKHASNFPNTYGLTDDLWVDLLKKKGGMDLIQYAIDREDIESGNIENVIGFIDSLLSSRESLLSVLERIDFSVAGYDNDKRELWDIPEVVLFLRAVNNARPYWLVFEAEFMNWTKVLMLCLCSLDSFEEGFRFSSEEEVIGLMNQWFSGLNEVSNKFAISYEVNKRLSDRFSKRLSEFLANS